MSSVPGLNARPQTAIRLSARCPRKWASIFSTSTCFCRWLTSLTASRICGGTPCWRAIAAKARRSLGKQLPPKPAPGKRKAKPMRLSWPMPRRTWLISAPVFWQRLAISLMKLILVARSALAAYLVISALSGDMHKSGLSVRK